MSKHSQIHSPMGESKPLKKSRRVCIFSVFAVFILIAATFVGVGAAIDGTPWYNGGTAPTSSGSYYLAEDVDISETWYVVGDTTLDLNGFTLNLTTASSSVINIPNEATLILNDDCGTGKNYKHS